MLRGEGGTLKRELRVLVWDHDAAGVVFDDGSGVVVAEVVEELCHGGVVQDVVFDDAVGELFEDHGGVGGPCSCAVIVASDGHAVA